MTDIEHAQNTEFVECEVCAAKPGTPTLCRSCLHNRAAIETLKENYDVNWIY